MSVEFIGLPGTGKSRICSELSESLRREPCGMAVHVHPPAEATPRLRLFGGKVFRAGLFVLRHPVAAARIAVLAHRSGQRSRIEGVLKTVNLYSEMGRTQNPRGGAGVRDQGVLQAVWSIALDARRPDIPALVRVAEPRLPSLVVLVEADCEEILGRIECRPGGRSRLDRLPPRRREEVLRSGFGLFEEIFATWGRLRPGRRSLRIRNRDGADLGETVARIREALEDVPAASSRAAERASRAAIARSSASSFAED